MTYTINSIIESFKDFILLLNLKIKFSVEVYIIFNIQIINTIWQYLFVNYSILKISQGINKQITCVLLELVFKIMNSNHKIGFF
jgi:hypothetical protein